MLIRKNKNITRMQWLIAQIKLTPEELRQSATKYTEVSQMIDDVLTSLTHEQDNIASQIG